MWTEWTPERENELRDLWLAGKSASICAEILQTSRNAVIGKVSRLKLPKRRAGTSRKRKRQPWSQERRERKRQKQLVTPSVVVAAKPKPKQAPQTKSQLYAMLAEAVRNTR